jgi:hypothetical protein
MGPNSRALTAQFYAWERRGRGWFLSGRTVDLEPAFEPFLCHHAPARIIDDGRRVSWLSRLLEPRRAKEDEPAVEPLLAHPDRCADPILVHSVALPRHGRAGLADMEQLLTMLSYQAGAASFEIVATPERIALQWTCSAAASPYFCGQAAAFFPEAPVVEAEADLVEEILRRESAFYTVDFGLEEEFMRPIAMPPESAEPYVPLFGVLERLRPGEAAIVQVLFKPAVRPWARSAVNAVCDDSRRNSFFLDDPDMPRLAREKVARPLFGVAVRAVAKAGEVRDAGELLGRMTVALAHGSASPHNRLMPLPTVPGDPEYGVEDRLEDVLLRRSHRTGMLLNSRELAGLAHYPSAALRTGKVSGTARSTRAAPDHLSDRAYVLGENAHRGAAAVVGIPREQRLRHLHVMGATGTGKSTLLHSLIMQDVNGGEGCMVLDPHGDLVDAVLSGIQESRMRDVVVIDPSDASSPVPLNLLSAHSDHERELLASDLVALFQRFSTSWGDQMHSVLANAILALLYNTETHHLGDLRRFLVEPTVRARILSTATDEDIAYYWRREFPLLKGGSVGPLLTRLDSFLRPRAIRAMLCQRKGLDMGRLMDGRGIVLVKLAQGLMGAENSYLLGALIVSKLQQTAIGRQSQRAEARVPFYCYIDEFQHFVTPSMASILSGARKYGLGLTVAHQDMAQLSKLDPEIAASVIANAGTRICFRLGDADARRMQEGFSSFSAEDLQNLGTGEAIVRVGTADCDFNLRAIPFAAGGDRDSTDAVIAHSRSRYGAAPAASQPAHVQSAEKAPTDSTPRKAPPVGRAQSAENRATGDPPASMREHRYVQAYVKRIAEAHGYRASIEAPTPGGQGLVDVLLERGGRTVAVEVSVTTPARWELHNVRKCLEAGYAAVLVCTDSAHKRRQLEARLASSLTEPERARVTVLASDEVAPFLSSDAEAAPVQATHKGYRVRVNYEPNADRQELVKSILAATRRRA